MTIDTGNREKFIVSKETTRGTLASFVNGFYLGSEVVMSDFNENQRSFKPRISVAGGMQRETMDKGAKLIQFSLKWKVTDFRFMQFFLSGLVEAGSDPYTHTFDLETSTSYNFFSLQRIIDDSRPYTYLGCAITRLRLEFQKATGDDEQGYIMATANCVATDFNKTDAKQTVTDSTTKNVFTFNQFKATIGSSVRNEIISGSIEIDSGTNPEDFFYCNADNIDLIGEVSPVFYKTVGNFTINVKDDTLIDEFEDDGITGTNKFEIIRSANDKIVFNIASIFNLQPFAPTEYKSVTKATVVYDTTLTNIVATDSVVNY